MQFNDESSFKILIDPAEFNNRHAKTKHLLSGGVHKPELVSVEQVNVPQTESSDVLPQFFQHFSSVNDHNIKENRSDRSVSSTRSSRKRESKNYGISDSDSGKSSASSSSYKNRKSKLTPQQQKILMDTIRDYVPESLGTVAYEDVINRMEHLHKKGFKLPADYEGRKHNIDENEIRLYEQQIERDKDRDKKKLSYMINFAAIGLNWFCQSMELDWIHTKYLPNTIKEAVKNGEFDDDLEGAGVYLRGTVMDNPLFSSVLKFVEKVGEANQKEIDEETERLEKEEEEREKRNAAALHKLNQFRGETTQKLEVPSPKKKK